MTIIAIILGVLFFALGVTIIYAVSRFAKRHELNMPYNSDDTDHAPEAEIDRAATSCWFGGNHFEF